MNRFTFFAGLLAFLLNLPALAQDKTKPKEPKSLAEIKSKAEAGDAKAQWSLGQIYESGRFLYGKGGKKDLKEAVKWFRMAAEQNDPQAQAKLGFMHIVGRGVKKDGNEATKWYIDHQEKPDISRPAQKKLSKHNTHRQRQSLMPC